MGDDVLDLQYQLDRIPEIGQDVQGELNESELWELLDVAGERPFAAPRGAQVSLHLSMIADALRVIGEVQLHIEAPCARCLEPASQDLREEIDLTLFPATQQKAPPRDMGDPEQAGDDDGAVLPESVVNTDTYSGDTVDLAPLLRELLLLDQPTRLLCSEGCAGLCDMCGHNLNLGPCQCVRDNVDPRWQALKEIKLN